MTEFIFTMDQVSKEYQNRVILDNVSMSFLPKSKIGILGPNGAGKSTLLKIMANLEKPSSGKAVINPKFSVGILMQEPCLNKEKTVLENIEEGVHEIKSKLDRFNEISTKMTSINADYDSLLEEMGNLQEDIDIADAWDLDSQLKQAMEALSCPPGNADIRFLSGGELRRVALCKLLLQKPDLLLLDEPTNHLDAESILWLEEHLATYPGAIISITHDRYFLEHVAEWIAEVDRGKIYPYKGNYSTYLHKKRERIEMQGKKDLKLEKRLKDEIEWIRSSPKGRQTKSKARLERYEKMALEAEKKSKLDFSEIQIPPGPRLGSTVIEVKNLTKIINGRTLFQNLSFNLPKNGIVGVIGPNGVGKTTLFNMIMGITSPDSGTIKVGKTVNIAYVDQNRSKIDPNRTVWDVVSNGLDFLKVGKLEIPSRAYISAFGFKGSNQQKKANVLSGGERNRLNLALTLQQGGNLLLLDEPTNDLDIETLTSLESSLLDFPGCAVIISHDRWFLDRIATHILAYEGIEKTEKSDLLPKWFWYEGNYESYNSNKAERFGVDNINSIKKIHKKLRRN